MKTNYEANDKLIDDNWNDEDKVKFIWEGMSVWVDSLWDGKKKVLGVSYGKLGKCDGSDEKKDTFSFWVGDTNDKD